MLFESQKKSWESQVRHPTYIKLTERWGRFYSICNLDESSSPCRLTRRDFETMQLSTNCTTSEAFEPNGKWGISDRVFMHFDWVKCCTRRPLSQMTDFGTMQFNYIAIFDSFKLSEWSNLVSILCISTGKFLSRITDISVVSKQTSRCNCNPFYFTKW